MSLSVQINTAGVFKMSPWIRQPAPKLGIGNDSHENRKVRTPDLYMPDNNRALLQRRMRSNGKNARRRLSVRTHTMQRPHPLDWASSSSRSQKEAQFYWQSKRSISVRRIRNSTCESIERVWPRGKADHGHKCKSVQRRLFV